MLTFINIVLGIIFWILVVTFSFIALCFAVKVLIWVGVALFWVGVALYGIYKAIFDFKGFTEWWKEPVITTPKASSPSKQDNKPQEYSDNKKKEKEKTAWQWAVEQQKKHDARHREVVRQAEAYRRNQEQNRKMMNGGY